MQLDAVGIQRFTRAWGTTSSLIYSSRFFNINLQKISILAWMMHNQQSPQRRTNRSDDSPHGICLLDTQPGTPQPLGTAHGSPPLCSHSSNGTVTHAAAHTETTKSFKLGSVAGAVLQSPNKKLYGTSLPHQCAWLCCPFQVSLF
jgi:hypothetical protein